MNLTQTDTIEISAAAYRDYNGGYFKVLISPEETAGSMGMIDITLPKGAEPPPHLHTREDETFYILEGEVLVNVGGEEVVLQPGQAAFAPRNVPHFFKVLTPQARCVITVTPGDFTNFFLEMSSPTEGHPQVTPLQGPPPAEAIAYVVKVAGEGYGVEFV